MIIVKIEYFIVLPLSVNMQNEVGNLVQVRVIEYKYFMFYSSVVSDIAETYNKITIVCIFYK